jgi:hypothetical protein
MSSFGHAGPRLIVATAAGALLLAIGASSASAAPGIDGQGYIDSTARCDAPTTMILFGSTETSRVAICKTAGGQYEYRGVRLRDGAKLVASASQHGDAFVTDNSGISYTVSTNSLVISMGNKVIRDESMVDVHQQQTAAAPASPPATTTPTTPLPAPLPAEVGGR